MDLTSYRKARGLSQAECAKALGLRSRSYICEIESGIRSASLKTALRIEKWSEGAVPASSLSPMAAQLLGRAEAVNGVSAN